MADKMTKAERRLIDAVMARYVEWRKEHGEAVVRRHKNVRTNPNGPIAAEMLKAAMAVEKERKRG